MNKSDSIKALAAALSKAQAELPSAKFDATNPFLKNKYASLGAVIEAARPTLAKFGLSVAQMVVGADERVIGLETVLMHESGEWISNTVYLPLEDEKGKSAAQVAGSSISYLRRYSLAAILGMYAEEDTDGNQPEHTKTSGSDKKAESATPKPVTAALLVKAGIAENDFAGKAIIDGLGLVGKDITVGLKKALVYRRYRKSGLESAEAFAKTLSSEALPDGWAGELHTEFDAAFAKVQE